MVCSSQFCNAIAVAAAMALSGCMGAGDQYPDLSLRDFERIQGTFASSATAPNPVAPSALGASQLADVKAALAAAAEHHAGFLAQAQAAQPRIAAAAGVPVEDNRWPVAQIEIASLESRNAETTSLLADLDSLYVAASLSFTEREQISEAREQVSEYHAAERQVIAELLGLLETDGGTQ